MIDLIDIRTEQCVRSAEGDPSILVKDEQRDGDGRRPEGHDVGGEPRPPLLRQQHEHEVGQRRRLRRVIVHDDEQEEVEEGGDDRERDGDREFVQLTRRPCRRWWVARCVEAAASDAC